MAVLFLFLFLVFFVCLIIGLIKPQRFNFVLKGKSNRKKTSVLFSILMLVSLVVMVVMVVTIPETTESTTAAKTERSTVTEKTENKASAEIVEIPEYESIGKWVYRLAGIYYEIVTKDDNYFLIVSETLENEGIDKIPLNYEDGRFTEPNNVQGEYYLISENVLSLWNQNGKITDFNIVNSDGSIEKTAGEIRKEKVESAFSAWDGSHIALTRLIKDNMNDPKSYQHVETLYGDKGDYILVVTKFRGKNAFGGLVLSTVTAKTDVEGNVLEIISQE